MEEIVLTLHYSLPCLSYNSSNSIFIFPFYFIYPIYRNIKSKSEVQSIELHSPVADLQRTNCKPVSAADIIRFIPAINNVVVFFNTENASILIFVKFTECNSLSSFRLCPKINYFSTDLFYLAE